MQLLGNLALSNLRRSHLGHLLREGRTIDRLDLSRSGGLFGGPYLWFNYITRMLVQETALSDSGLQPPRGSARSPGLLARRRSASKFRNWLADRLKIDPEEVWLPELSATDAVTRRQLGPPGKSTMIAAGRPQARCDSSARKEAGAFLETVEFTAVDFLADEPERDCEIHARFGPQVAELVRRDRQQNVRRAFRSFPLHELPLDRPHDQPVRILRSPPRRRPNRPACPSSWLAAWDGPSSLGFRSISAWSSRNPASPGRPAADGPG